MRARDIYNFIKAVNRHKEIYCDDMPECEECPLHTEEKCLKEEMMKLCRLIESGGDGCEPTH